jgi:dTDP-4-dehydrorhamnose reductase
MTAQPQPIAPILLISPDGMLGRAWVQLLGQRGLAFEAVSFPSFDVRDEAQVCVAIGPDVRTVINCSAYTDVDGAETHEAEAHAVNAEGVAQLARRCKATGALLVHYSTDYVFDGQASVPYACTQERKPQNAYGRSKARGEELLLAAGCAHLLLRTSWLYAPWGKNFVDTIARAGRERPVLRVVNDQHGRPTSAQYLAERTLALLDARARGIFHVTDGGQCTWFEFATEIVQRSGGTARVEPCTSGELVRPATRPAYSVLDLQTTEALLGPCRSWQDNLADVLRQREGVQLP